MSRAKEVWIPAFRRAAVDENGKPVLDKDGKPIVAMIEGHWADPIEVRRS